MDLGKDKNSGSVNVESDIFKTETDEVHTEKSMTETNKSVESVVPTKGKNENI